VHLGRARTIAALLTIQAGLAVYSGVRAASAFMQGAASAREQRPAAVSAQPNVGNAVRAIPSGSVINSGFQEIVDPWQPLPRVAANPKSDDLVDPWSEKTTAVAESELIDPWASERSLAASPIAAFDLHNAEAATGLLNPWPTIQPSRDYDLPELIDPWSTAL